MADLPLSLRYKSLTEALEKLAQTMWALRLGGTHDQRRHKALDEVVLHLRPLLERLKSIELTISTHSMEYAGELVYRETDRSRSLAFRLFREGVDTLTLSEGVTAVEFATLATILSIPPDVAEHIGDDLVTRTWRDPLPNVRVTVRPWHAMRTLDPVNPTTEMLEAYAADALVFFAHYAAGNSGRPGLVDPIDEALERVADLAQRSTAGALAEDRSPPQRYNTLEAHDETSDALEDVFALLISVMLSEELLVPLDILEELVVAVVRSIMSQGDPAAVNRIYERLGGLDVSQELVNLDRALMPGRIRAQAASAKTLHRLLPAQIGVEQTVSLDWLPAFFAKHCRDRLDHFEEVFTLNLTTPALEVLTATVLQTFSPPHDFWARLLTDVSAEVATVVIETLDTVCDERSRTLLYLSLASHRNAKIRRRAIASFPLLGPRVQAVLEESLRDRDVSVRVAAIGKLAQTGVPSVGIFLVDALRRADPSAVDHTERRAILAALPQLGGDRYLHLLLDQLEHYEGSLGRLSNPESTVEYGTCLAVLDAIASIGTRRTVTALEARIDDASLYLSARYAEALARAQELYEESQYSEPPQPAPPPMPTGDELLEEDVPSDPNLPDISDLLYSYVNESPTVGSDAEAAVSADGLMDALEGSQDSFSPPRGPDTLPPVDLRLQQPSGSGSTPRMEVSGSGTRPTRPVTRMTRAPESGKVSTRPTRSTRPPALSLDLHGASRDEDSVTSPRQSGWMDRLDDPHLNQEVSGMIEDLMRTDLTLDGDGGGEEDL